MLLNLLPKGFEFTPRHGCLLRELGIDDHGPGTILHDFDAFLAFIKEREMSVTPMRQLRRRMLPMINDRLARPIPMRLKKPLQKSYPHIHGLYLLVRASGLTYVEGTAKKPLLVVDDAVYQTWQGLNPTERYCTLLETWLLRGHPEIIAERENPWFRIPDTFTKLVWFLQRIPSQGLRVAGDKEVEDSIPYEPQWHNLGLMELFGLIAIKAGPPEPGKGWRVERIDRTPLGEALLALLLAGFFGDIDRILALESEEMVPFGALQPTLQPFFPEWKTHLSVPERIFRNGAHTFQVKLWEGVWRRIAVPAESTLDELARSIQEAFQFDHDHLYMFAYQDRFGITRRINHSFLDDGPWTSEVLVGDTPLKMGHEMTFVFDFGDWWEFAVTLERVDPAMAIQKPVVLEIHGEPPDQYPVWDDEGW
jgi:hypothetical protein